MSTDSGPSTDDDAGTGVGTGASGSLLRLARTSAGDVHAGLVAQLSTLVGAQPIEYQTTNLTRNAHGNLEGTVVVYTPSTVLVQRVTPTEDGAAVSIAAVARGALRRLETSEEEHRRTQDGDAPSAQGWPSGGLLFATYENFPRGLQLPLRARTEEEVAAFRSFLPSLVADLSRSDRP